LPHLGAHRERDDVPLPGRPGDIRRTRWRW
jgi:hypothetical protein